MIQEKKLVIKSIEHLFRHESGKIVAHLTGYLGSDYIEIAEDAMQEAIKEAIHVWSFKGIPDNPIGWIYVVAKRKALNFVQKEKLKYKYTYQVTEAQISWLSDSRISEIHEDDNINDDQLRLMFLCCHPSLSYDSQIAIILKTLCGFSISEIARGFLTTDDAIHKRLVRARKTIQENRISFELPPADQIEVRLNAVLEVLYLLFNEGYSASNGTALTRSELCDEAIRLAYLIINHPYIRDNSATYALLSMMLLSGARLTSRMSTDNQMITLGLQNRSQWDAEKIKQGIVFLEKSVTRPKLGKYHILAAISAHHCTAKDENSTDWEGIIKLYDSLLKMENSPVIVLNRSVAIYKKYGPDRALKELQVLESDPLLLKYPYFYSIRGELYLARGQLTIAKQMFKRALDLVRTESEKKFLLERLESFDI